MPVSRSSSTVKVAVNSIMGWTSGSPTGTAKNRKPRGKISWRVTSLPSEAHTAAMTMPTSPNCATTMTSATWPASQPSPASTKATTACQENAGTR